MGIRAFPGVGEMKEEQMGSPCDMGGSRLRMTILKVLVKKNLEGLPWWSS